MATNEDDWSRDALGMARTAQQEGFGDAFLLAVAGVAGCAVSWRRPDDDSIDWTLSCKLMRRPKLDVQMKTTTAADDGAGEVIQYPLKIKNYNDLILTNVLAPRVLVLVTADQYGGLAFADYRSLVLQRCGYWVSLAGKPESDNATSVTVSVPRQNLLTPEAVRRIMRTINERGAL